MVSWYHELSTDKRLHALVTVRRTHDGCHLDHKVGVNEPGQGIEALDGERQRGVAGCQRDPHDPRGEPDRLRPVLLAVPAARSWPATDACA